ncbi:MAG: hypothetical protein ABSH39_03720 [Candidatus Acidiferrum sp.]|jgi:hypothetical protein
MFVHSVQNGQAASNAQEVSRQEFDRQQANQKNPLPRDTVSISTEALAKQTAASIGFSVTDNATR